LGVQYALIGEVQEDPIKTIRTVAVSAGGAVVDNFEYPLANTPCGSVVEHSMACVERDARITFPAFALLAQLSIDGYCGVAIKAKDGTVIGSLAVMDTKPLHRTDWLQSLLTVFAPRAGAELHRRRTETKLRREHRRLQEAQALAHLGSWDWDIDGGAVQWSEEQFRIFGHEPRAAVVTDDTVLASLHPDDHDRVLAAVNDSLVKNTVYDLEYRIVRPNGEIRTVHGRGEVSRDDTGHPIRMTGTCLDITDRTRAEKAVLESEARFRTIVDIAPAMIWIAGPDKLCTYFNKPWLTYTGRAIEQELGNGWTEGVHPDDLARCLKTYFEAFGRREPVQLEYRLKKADGTYGWILEHGAPLWQEDGTVTSYIGTCVDITIRKRIEVALSENEDWFRMVFEQAAVGMAMIETSTGRFVHVNHRHCEITRRSASDLLTRTFMDLTYPEDLQTDLDNMQRLIAGDIPSFTMEKRNVRMDGSVDWINLTVLPMWKPGQKPDYHLAIIEDITARKQAEEALRTSQEKLQQALLASVTGLWDWNTETNEVSLSREWKRQLGYEDAELPDEFETWETRLHPDDRTRAVAYAKAYAARPDGHYRQEFRLRHKDGTYRWIEARASFVTELDGRRVRLLGSHTDTTARRHMEEAVRESEARLQSLIEAIPQQVWTARPDGTLDYVNRRVLDYFDCQPDDLLGWEWQSVLHPDDLPACQASWSSALRTGEPYEIEFRLRRAIDGAYRWHLARAMPVKDPSNRILKWFGTNTDITERKQAEQALRISEERYARATAVGRVGVWELDTTAGIYHGDANLKALFGYRDDELSTDPSVWLDLVHPEDRSVAEDHWRSIIAGESDSFNHELRMIKKNGTVIWTDVRGHAVRDADSRLTHLFGATVDITDRKRAEESLRESEERLRLVLDTLPAAAYTCDADGLITYFNERAAELWGRAPRLNHPADRFCGSLKLHGPDHDLIPHDQCWMAVAVKEGRAVNGNEIVIERPDGSLRSVLAHANPLLDPSGRLVGGVNVLIDITERKRAEAALQQRELDLRQAIAEREQISQDLHDGILQSLYAVGLGLESCKPLLRQRGHRKATTVLEQAVGQLNHVMAELRNFIAGLESQVVQGGDFPTALRTMVESVSAAHAITCRVMIEEAAAHRISTEQALHLMNIVREALSNSLRHSHAKRITVSLKQLARSVRLSVTDDGVGFNPAAAHGIGHGLANIAARSRKVGGQLAVRSKPKQGVKILLDLPKEALHAYD
jgi:PAS domain S-box-containing protein